jgi:[ribosomal protein S5]-alanine N-acetyltransferase
MKYYLETERLILRDLLLTDEVALFEMDSNQELHKYLGNKPSTNILQSREMIQNIRQQYVDNGIGRWAVIEKETGNFIGWSGLKFITEEWNNHINYYDVGYRFHPDYWNKGYATESTMAALDYGFNELKLSVIYGAANIDNKASRNVLEKCGLKFIEKFDFPLWNGQCDWLKISKEEWRQKTK